MESREKKIIVTSIFGIAGNFILVIFKAIVGIISSSVSIITDAINNLTDALSSIITIIGTKLSTKKPDKDHPFGHGRIEYITASIIAVVILFAGGVAIYQSILSIIDYFKDNIKPSYEIVSLIIIGVAILIKIGIGVLYLIQAKKTESETLKASGKDAINDVILSSSTLVAAIISYTLGWYIEGYLGILIGLYIIKSGVDVLRESFSSIIGERYDAEETRKIIADINQIEGVKGTYDLILNSYGHKKNIGSAHIMVDGHLDGFEIQKIERNIVNMMYTKYKTIMTIGIYASNDDNEISRNILSKLNQIIKEYRNIIQMHGFYVDLETKFCNFDLVFSFDEENPEGIIATIQKELEANFNDFKFYITLDRDFSVS